MDDRRKAAFEFARDSTKQLITLATAILTVTITLVTGFSEFVPQGAKAWLGAAWVLYMLSIVFGAATLLALTGTLEPAKGKTVEASIRGKNVVIPSALQVMLFLSGTIVAVTGGLIAL